MEPFETLFDRSPVTDELPSALAALYGGNLGLRAPVLYANFVTTIDGVAALEPLPDSSVVIGRRSEADRFLMGLLRAFADVVVIGSGTLRAAPTHRWTPEHVFAAGGDQFADLRRRLGRSGAPELVVVSGSGKLDGSHPALQAGAVILTSAEGVARLGTLPDGSTAIALGSHEVVEPTDVIEFLHERGHRFVLTEGGPTIFGSFLSAGLVDELFLTVSPVLSGRDDSDDRPGLVEGITFPPQMLQEATLISARRHGSHLFLRYEIDSKR